MLSVENKAIHVKRARRSRSVVWYYFDKSPSDPFKATCKICNLVCNNASNTTNLFSHLRVKHPQAYEEAKVHKEAVMDAKQPGVIQITDKMDQKPLLNNAGGFKDKAVKRPRSVVWYYFDKDPVQTLRAKCKICGMPCMRGTNTTNLFNHLKVKHPSVYSEAIAQKDVEIDLYIEMKGGNSQTKSNSFVESPAPKKRGRPPKSKLETSLPNSESSAASNTTPNANFSPTLTAMNHASSVVVSRKSYGSDKTRRSADKLLMNLIAGNLLSPSIVEIKGFKEFVRALDSRYELPTKKTILKSMLPELAEETKSKIKLEVHIASYFALTVESWIYRESQNCITLMAHFIKDSWESTGVILETFDCTDKNNGESIALEMKRITDEWGISDKVISVISNQMEDSVTSATLSMGWEHLACFGQMLNSVVLTAMASVAEIARIQTKANEVVAYFNKNVKASDTLQSVQQHHGLPKHRLKEEVADKWTSRFYMMSRMVEQFEAVNTVLCYLGKDSMCLCDDEVELMRLIVEVLRPFEAATKELFTCDYAAMSKVIPLTTLLQEVTASVVTGNSLETPEPQSALRKALLTQMQIQFVNLESNYSLAVTTLLDPRFKHHAFTDAAALEMAQNRLLQEIISTVTSSEASRADTITMTVTNATDINGNPSVNNVEKESSGSLSIWNMFDRKVSEAGAQKTSSSEADNESRRYFKEAIISRSSDPLRWWKLNQVQFPHLKVLAQKYLCIPANAMSSSRLFSKKGEEFIERRNKIKPSSLHTMVFLSSNV